MLQREPRKDERPIPVSGEVSDTITPTPSPRDGMRFSRRFTRPGTHPYDEVEWELRDAVISSGSGEVAFEQRNV